MFLVISSKKVVGVRLFFCFKVLALFLNLIALLISI